MRRVTTSALVIVGLALAGCTSEKPAEVKAEATDSSSVVVQSEDPTLEPDTESEDASDDPAIDEPTTAALGDTVTVGDWDIKVTKLLLNANDAVHKANMFNDKPKGVYVLATYEATYNGTERTADIWTDLTWSFTTSDGQIHDPAAQVTPADNEEWPTSARQGATVRGQQVWDLKPNMIQGGILSVEGYDENFDTVYADFGV